MPVSIVLADDHQLVRHGLRALLEAEADFQIVGEAGEGNQVLTLVEQLKPTVLLLDLAMPGLDGLEIARRTVVSVPQTRIVVLSMHASEAYVWEALRQGVAGYVLKQAQGSVVIRAVREAAAGRRFLSPPFSESSLQSYAQRTTAALLDPYDSLTQREREVLRLAAESLSSPEIGERLCISSRTVETHRANLMRKLGLANLSEMIRYAIRRGILPLDQ